MPWRTFLAIVVLFAVWACAPSARAASDVAPTGEQPGSGGRFDYVVPGVLSYLDADHQGRVEHEYAWTPPPGAMVEASLTAAFDAYLEVADRQGMLLAENDDSGGSTDAQVVIGPVDGDTYVWRVTSASGDETGRYTLRLRLLTPPGGTETGALSAKSAQPPERVLDSENPPSLPRPLPVGTMHRAQMADGERLARYELPVPSAGATLDVWLFAESDFDLYGGVSGPEGVVSEAASQEAYGYEHIRLDASTGSGVFRVHVALYDAAAPNMTYFLLSQVGAAEITEASTAPKAAGAPDSSPYAGRLRPDRRRRATIRTDEYATQFWSLIVPEGVHRVEVGVFDARRDMDLAVERGWRPVVGGAAHEYLKTTRRWNERVVLDGGEAPLTPGVYTVAVWPAAKEESALRSEVDYSIQAAFDASLPSSSSYEGFTPEELSGMSGVDRAHMATVWIESDFRSGAGIVISPNGLILTNYHVISDCHPSSSVPAGCLAEEPAARPEYLEEEYLIRTINRHTGRAEQHFAARVVDVLSEYDLALLEISSDIDGRPAAWIESPDGRLIPFVPVGECSTTARKQGDDFLILGFPTGAPIEPITSEGASLEQPVMWNGIPVLLQIRAEGAAWHAGAPVVQADGGGLIGLVTDRAGSYTGTEDTWAVRPAALVPGEWRPSQRPPPAVPRSVIHNLEPAYSVRRESFDTVRLTQ